jgi:sulfofructose kinase
MSARWDVLGFGAVAVDDLLYVEQYPPPDTKAQVLAERREGGGLTGTALVAAARLGAKAAYCGVLGEDDLSRFTVEALEREGVDCEPVLYHPGARPIHSRIVVDQSTGGRNIFFSYARVVERQPEEMTDDLISACRVLFVDHTVMAGGLRAIAIAHAHGIPVVVDVERNVDPRLPDLLRQVDHLILGVVLAGRVTGETEPDAMVRALARAGQACCVVTAGDRGCWYAEHGGDIHHFPAFKVPVIDTTGCGDVFHGAYAVGVAQDLGVEETIRLASATAAIKATKPGGRSGIPDRDTLGRFLQGCV